jgi:hypothetical protein
MRLKPGCGCLVAIVGLINLLFFALVIFGMIRGGTTTYTCPECQFQFTEETSFGILTLLFAFLFLVSGLVTLTVGWGNVRSRRGSPKASVGSSLGLGEE